VKTDNRIKLGVDAVLGGAEFHRKSSTWYRDLNETVLVVEVQKSNFGEQYYLNLGVFVKGLVPGQKDKLPPKENECHIRFRIEALKPEDEAHFKQMLNVEDGSMSSDDRQTGVEKAIAEVALPFLLQCGTRAGIGDAYRAGMLDRALMHRLVREQVLAAST
jgi:Domain of unknown function (DUF4304)